MMDLSTQLIREKMIVCDWLDSSPVPCALECLTCLHADQQADATATEGCQHRGSRIQVCQVESVVWPYVLHLSLFLVCQLRVGQSLV